MQNENVFKDMSSKIINLLCIRAFIALCYFHKLHFVIISVTFALNLICIGLLIDIVESLIDCIRKNYNLLNLTSVVALACMFYPESILGFLLEIDCVFVLNENWTH